MHRVNQAVSVLRGGLSSPTRRQPPILAAYEHFRLDRQGMLVSPRTLEYYDGMVLPFLRWAEADGLERFEALDVSRFWTFRKAGKASQ
jgi:hypothetical protein